MAVFNFWIDSSFGGRVQIDNLFFLLCYSMILAWSVSIVLASYTSTRRRLKGNGSPLYFSPFFLLIDFDLFTLTTALLSFTVSYFFMFKITFLAFLKDKAGLKTQDQSFQVTEVFWIE